MERGRQSTCCTTFDSMLLRFSCRTSFWGRFVEVVFRDFESDQDKRNKTIKLVDMMESNRILWENMKPTEKDAFDIMVDLSNRDESLDATDIMIVSHVLSDPDSRFFFTMDSNILENADIIDLENDLNTNGERRVALKTSNGF